MLVQCGQAGRGSGPVGRRGREYGGRRTGRGRVMLSVQAAEVGRRRRRNDVRRGRRRAGRRDRGLRLSRRRHVRLALVARGHQPVEVELVRVPFAVHFRHDVLVVIIPARHINISYHFRLLGTARP